MSAATSSTPVRGPPPRPARLAPFWANAMGKKALMAATGLVLFVFTLLHMLGNLQVFSGPTRLDRYAELLRVEPALLWTVRLVLLAALLLHVVAGFQLQVARQQARPIPYREWRAVTSTPASRTMIWSGILVLGFVVYHLLDLTFGVANPDFRSGAVFHNLVVSLARGAAALFYVVAVVGLAFHLWHGLYSTFQSLGMSNRAFTPAVQRGAAAVATLLAAGFAAVPLAVVFGLVGR